MAGYSQADRPLRFDSPLGPDTLLATGFSGVEGVSAPFCFRVDLLSEDPSIAAGDLLRQPVVLTIVLEDGTERHIHGLVSRFVQLGQDERLTAYQAEMVPWLWFLSLSRDCRIYQNVTVPDIVEQVFRSYGYSDFQNKCTGTYPVREYCVQYRETHLDFISRLLEEEGIFYFFEHTDSAHTLVLADRGSSVGPCPGLPRGAARMAVEPAPDTDVVTALRQEHAVHTGTVTLNHYDYLQPTLSLESSVSGEAREEAYDYPGKYTTREEGERYARVRLEAAEALRQVIRGASTCRAFRSGTRFDLTEHYRSDANQTYVLLEVHHTCSGGDYRTAGVAFDYRNEFLAIPASVPYRPPVRAPRPVVRGSQTALVVGKQGEEIWVDRHGRVKVQFYWDREGRKDENSSCWVRVSSAWAGKGWGVIQIPRVGQEVVVDFLEGDPDQPIITGRVYNAEQTPPYTLPANQTQSGLKTRSTKQGTTETFNELRFEDKKGEEEVYLHAEKNLKTVVENDETREIGLIKKDPGGQTITIHGDQTVTLNEGSQTVTLKKGDQTLEITEGKQTTTIKGDQTTTLQEGAHKLTLDQGHQAIELKQGNQTVTLTQGDQTLDVKQGNQKITLGQGNQVIEIRTGNQTIELGAGNLTTKLKAGKSTHEAVQGIELKVGGNSIKIGPEGITIKGMTVKIEGQLQVQVKGLMTEVKGTAMLKAQGGITMIN